MLSVAAYDPEGPVKIARVEEPVQHKGKFVLSNAPGLGLELDETELKKRMIPWTSSAPGAR